MESELRRHRERAFHLSCRESTIAPLTKSIERWYSVGFTDAPLGERATRNRSGDSQSIRDKKQEWAVHFNDRRQGSRHREIEAEVDDSRNNTNQQSMQSAA